MQLKNTVTKTVLGAMLGASLLLGSATQARADREDKCHHDFRKAQENLDKEVRKHGEHSPQAERRRRELEEVRDRCHMR